MKRFSTGLLLAAACALTGCSNLGGRHSETVRLKATMDSPVDITLEWTDGATNVAGYVLEYTNDPAKEEYVPLGFFPPGRRRFEHSRLLPLAKFFYRVRPYYGLASNPVEVSLPSGLTDEAYAARFAQPEDFSWAGPEIIPVPGVSRTSLRGGSADAAPSNLQAQLVSPLTVSGFRLTWTDHANDEDGFFLEGRPDGSLEYLVCAQTEPDVNAFGWTLEPPHRKGSFRVRAFYYGPPSNVVVKETGKDPRLANEHLTK